MSVKLINRPARITTPLTPPKESALAAPPGQGDAAPGGFPLHTMLPVLGSMSSITMMVVMRGSPVMVMVGGIVLVVALVGGVGMAVGQRGNAARTRKRERERYLDYLETRRAELRDLHADTRREALLLNPDPGSLTDVVRNPERLWERRRADGDFLCPRVGSGVVPWFPLTLPADPNPVQPHDAIMASEARTVLTSHTPIAGMPVTVSLRDASHVSVVGDPELLYPVIRALLAQLAVFHAPDDLKLGIVVPPEKAIHFAGADLLPQLLTDEWDGPVQARRIAPTAGAILALLREELTGRVSRALARQRGSAGPTAETPIILIVDDTGEAPAPLSLPEGLGPAQLGLTVITLVTDRLREPGDTRLRLTLTGTLDDVTVTIDDDRAPGRRSVSQTADTMSDALFAALASRLAPLRLSVASRDELDTARDIDALELLGIASITEVSPDQWRRQNLRDFLRVPVASGDDGAPVHIDLKESAHGGMGPHGICIGATGSGKSEFLRTLILSLSVSHGPEDLAMILVDYKGGAAFTPFAGLPHIAGLIDNLADDAQLIERARASIQGEIVRRQRLLKDAGGFASITEYRAARATNPDLEPLPHLFLVIDEFGELLTAEPDFIDLLLQIGRIGRALGIHLLLSSQRIEGGKLKGLDTYLSYRIGLRTFSEQESAVILETPDAFHLPPVPGYGYLKVDTTVYTRFKAGYVSGPLPPDAARQMHDEDEKAWGVLLQPTYNTIDSESATADEASPSSSAASPTVIDETVARLRPGTAPTNPIWLPPLPDRLPLFQIIDHPDRVPLHVPVGLLDDPLHQAQRPWEVDLTRSGGHFAIIGAPQTGRTTFLRAFAAGTASVTTPRQVAMYGLDLTGAGLTRLEDFPHVGGVATRSNSEQQVRLLEELAGMIAHREMLFRTHRIESLTQFRSRHAAGEIPSIIAPDIVLLVDGYGLVRTDFEHLADPLADLLIRGGSFGIHLVLGLTRWNELTMSLQPLIGNKFELRLNDPTESSIKRKLAETIRTDQPGRVLTDGQLFAQVALPAIDDVEDDDLGDALTALAQQTAAAWNGPAASPILLLPENLDPATLPDEFDEPDALPIGLRQDTMEPALLDLAGADQHVLVLGDAASGKTTLLRQIMRGLIDRHTPDELVIALMEPRGTLAASIPDDYLGGHANNVSKAKQLAAALALELDKRQNDGAPANLRIVVLIDDYDILATGGNNPLEPLLRYLPSARDLKLNVILTRPVAGSARAIYENTIQTLKDTGGTGIVLSGERSEGPLWPGVHASQAVAGRAKLVRRGQPPRLIQIANRAT